MQKRSFLLLLLCTFLAFNVSFAQKNDKKEEVPLTFAMLEKCLNLDIDTVEKILMTTGFTPSGDAKEKQILTDKWKPSRIVLLTKGKVELVIVFNTTSNVYHFTLSSESSKDKIGEDLFNESLKAGYKEITHEGENPKVTRKDKREARYNTANKPWTFDLNGKK